jgi:hypothetical protein
MFSFACKAIKKTFFPSKFPFLKRSKTRKGIGLKKILAFERVSKEFSFYLTFFCDSKN